jgi:polyisoprenoid-binding protein YceI
MATVANEKAVIPAGTWKVDPVHSNIGFQVVDTSELMSTITGRFTDFKGTFEAGDDPASARAYGVIRAASVTTDQDQRDAHLRSPDFFDSDRHPEIGFETTRIEATEGDSVRVSGTLTIKGEGLEVVLDGRVLTGTSAKGEERLIFQSRGGIAWGPMNVEITASVSAARQG